MKFIVTATGENGDVVKTCDTSEAAFEQASALLMTDATVVTITDGDGAEYVPDEFRLHFLEHEQR
ncbi:hypothetical protein [Methyloferula stellata]|uniref:hypothetical protein n=1 Tax=Methyloferula stellata TaxID=876270 RepID=UPI00036EC228|nr:hypothetical protein [Methyloferula stellata]